MQSVTTGKERVEIRMARAGLGWSASRLADAASVGRSTIARIEAGASVRKSSIDRVRRALAAAGARFAQNGPEPSVSLRVRKS